jgi:serine/threonine protein kinase
MRTQIGQYRIESALGRGGMGVVYRGVHEHLGREVAVKALAPELTQQPEFRDRFFSEAKTQARLQHPNIVGVYDLQEDAGEYFIIMEFVAGEPLDDRLRALAGQSMDLGEALGLFSQVLAALDYAHSEGVIHRDIKPSNVLITTGGRAKLMDFGIALLVGDKRLTASQSTIGTPTYMSPEQILRPRSVDHRTDIYSAAVVFFEMLAGRPPFDDDTEYGIKKLHIETPPPDLSQLRPDLPPGIAGVMAVALSKNPDERYPSAGAFLRALQSAAPQVEIPAGALPPSQPAYRPTVIDPARSTGVAPVVPLANTPVSSPSPGGAPPAKLLEGRNRWVVLGAAAVLVLAIGFGGILLLLRLVRGSQPVVAEAAPMAAPVTAQTLAPPQNLSAPATPIPAEAVPLAVPLSVEPPVTQISQPRPRPEPREESEPRPKERSRPSQETAAPTPAPAPAEPAAPAPPPAEEESSPSAAGADAAIDRFKAMEDVIVNIESLSERALEAYEETEMSTPLGTRLESFTDRAVALRKEFRSATGTGLRGTFGNLKNSISRNRAGREGDTRLLEIKARELVSGGGEIDGLISGDAAGPAVESYWREIRGQLRRLDAFFR